MTQSKRKKGHKDKKPIIEDYEPDIQAEAIQLLRKLNHIADVFYDPDEPHDDSGTHMALLRFQELFQKDIEGLYDYCKAENSGPVMLLLDILRKLKGNTADIAEGLTEIANKIGGLSAAIDDLNTLKIGGDGEEGVKIWPKGDVHIYAPKVIKQTERTRGSSAKKAKPIMETDL